MSSNLAIESLDDFVFGWAPKPVHCGHELSIGGGEVIPEINFTLPPMKCTEATWPEVLGHYQEMIGGVLQRAVDLDTSGLMVEFETVPDMTLNPEWGLEICRLLADALAECHAKHGLKCALRFTPNDTREFSRPPLMRQGNYWRDMQTIFDKSGQAGADIISIESTGGKEVCDDALMQGDLRGIIFALGVLAPRDMKFLWETIVASCQSQGIVPGGDTACGFANTAMVLADQKMIPRVLAAVVRVASVPRSLVAYEVGAVGPSKDCAYEGPYLKAIAGVPISMEGRSSACAHLSPVGNVSQAVCDLWSNESVQNVSLLSAKAPVVSMEQLAYDCRLMATAAKNKVDAHQLRNWLSASDAALDPQAFVLQPEVVLRISGEIMKACSPYQRTLAAVRATADLLKNANKDGELNLAKRESKWLNMLGTVIDELPEDEEEFVESMRPQIDPERCLLEEYGM